MGEGGKMAKRKRNNKNTNKKREKEGRGSGHLADYKPWIMIQDVASKGTCTRIKGLKTGRAHHLLSTLELNCFYCLDWCEQVYDIREQYPLDLDETLAIADELRIRHPKVPVTQENVVITTDFLVTLHNPLSFKEIAISVKYAKDLQDARIIEKLEIERHYWHRRGIDWLIVTEKQINFVLVKNIKWIHHFSILKECLPQLTSQQVASTANYIFELICQNKPPLRKVAADSDNYFSYSVGTTLTIVRHLIGSRQLIVDMSFPIQPAKPLSVITLKIREVSK